MGSMTTLHQVTVGVMTLTLVLCIIATSTKNWYERENTVLGQSGETYAGIWRFCTKTSISGTTCQTLEFGQSENNHKIKVVRAFSVLAIITFAMATISLIIVIKSRNLFLCFICLAVPAILFQMIAMAVYTDLYKDFTKQDGAKYGWSFALGWLGFILPIFGLAGGIVLKLSGSEIE